MTPGCRPHLPAALRVDSSIERIKYREAAADENKVAAEIAVQDEVPDAGRG